MGVGRLDVESLFLAFRVPAMQTGTYPCWLQVPMYTKGGLSKGQLFPFGTLWSISIVLWGVVVLRR
jgi:hypothetical protein